jgi:RND family efflux transporter MFP subunit
VRVRALLALSALCAVALVAAAGAAAPETPIGPFDGVIHPAVTAPLGVPLDGRLGVVVVDRGDAVRAGQVLASLECEVEELDLALAEENAARTSDVEAARVRIEHTKALLEARRRLGGIVSGDDLRTLETEERLAELSLVEAEERRRIAALEVDRSRARLALRKIVSPCDGVVTARHRSPGELVDATTAVLTVARIDPLRVETIVPVEFLGRIVPGSEAVVTSAAPRAPVLRAKVERIDPVVDPASHTFGVRLALPNPDGRIAAGVRCHVRFER